MENLNDFVAAISENPSAAFALLGVLLLIFFGLYARKIKFTTKMLVNISLMLAFTIVLNQIRLYHFPQGGAVTPGSMIPLLFVSYAYGPGVGALTGFIFGMVNMILDPFILHPVQVLFDYPLPMMAMGLAGFFPGRKFLGAGVSFFTRFVCHFTSGVVFFASYAPEGMSPVIYSLAANASYLVPEFVICCVILKVLPIERLLAAMKRN